MSVTPYSPATAAATGAISTRHVRVRRQGRDDSPNELRAFGVAPAFFPLFRFHGADRLMSSSGRTASVAASWNHLRNRHGESSAIDAEGPVTPRTSRLGAAAVGSSSGDHSYAIAWGRGREGLLLFPSGTPGG